MALSDLETKANAAQADRPKVQDFKNTALYRRSAGNWIGKNKDDIIATFQQHGFGHTLKSWGLAHTTLYGRLCQWGVLQRMPRVAKVKREVPKRKPAKVPVGSVGPVKIPPALQALLDLLPTPETLKQFDKETWLEAFTATVHLCYPDETTAAL